MSVINKMLQDLDARAARPVGTLPPAVPVVHAARTAPRRSILIVLAAVLVLALALAVWVAQKRVAKPLPVVVAQATPVVKTVVLAPVPLPVAGSAPVAPPAPLPQAAPAPTPAAAPLPPAASAMLKPVTAAAPHPVVKSGNAPVTASASPNTATRIDSPYRRALGELADGRKGDAIAALEQALLADPRNGAARETLVGLLIEAQRKDEAVAQLQAALAVDVRQPVLAMLLARLQIERGGDGVDTLARTLPFAAASVDGGAGYHAFFAGALQRHGRPREAIAQYQAALQLAPDQAVWWMGLGLSLRADGQAGPAAEAFRRARACGLSAELDAFVARQL